MMIGVMVDLLMLLFKKVAHFFWIALSGMEIGVLMNRIGLEGRL
jgi:riboflavin transporter FmnP